MDFVSPILDLTCRLCNCIGRNTNYIRHLQKKLNCLRSEMEKLMEQRNDVKTRVESAESQQMQRTEQVNGWLRRVEQLQSEVEVLFQQGDEEIQQKCVKICPRNCWFTHKLGKKVCKKLQDVADRMNEGNFSSVAIPLSRPLQTTVGSDANVNEVLSFLRDDAVGLLGIYGMVGVKKTTLFNKLITNNEVATQLSQVPSSSPLYQQVSSSNPSPPSIEGKASTSNLQQLPPRPSYSSNNIETDQEGNLVCKVCEVACSGDLNFKQHLEGQKHKTKLQQSQLSKEPWCELCQIECPSEDSLKMHQEGKKHKAKLQQSQLSKEEDKEEKDQRPWCKLCQIECPSEDSLKMHQEGKKHKAKLQQLQLSKEEDKEKKDQRLWCQPCQIECTNEDLLKMHLKDQKHPAKLQQLQLSKEEDKEKKDQQPCCELCQIECTSEDSLNAHRKGRKHQAKLLRSKTPS